MGLEIPDSLQWVAKYVVGGGDWPEGDETAMRRLADSWDGLAETLGTIDEDADAVVRDVLTALSAGQAHDAVSTMWAPIGGDQGAIQELIKRCQSQADSLDKGATDIEHTKYTIIAAMVILAAELAVALATSWTGIGAAAGVAARVATQVAIRMVVRGLIQRILSRMLAKAALRAAAIGAFTGLLEEGGSDLAARLIQVARGDRDGLTAADWKAVGLVSLAGTAGGAVGGGLGSGGALHGLTNQVENRVSRLGAQAAADTASGVAGEVAGQLAIVPFGGEMNLGIETLTSSASSSVATTAASAGPHGHNNGGEHSSGETEQDPGQPAPAADNPAPSKTVDNTGDPGPAADPGKPSPATTDLGSNTATEPGGTDTSTAGFGANSPGDTQTSPAATDSGHTSQPAPTDSGPAQPSQPTTGPAPSDTGPALDTSHAAPPDTGTAPTTPDPGTTPAGTDIGAPATPSNPSAPVSPDTLAPDTGVGPPDSHTTPPGPQDVGNPTPATTPTPHESGTGTPDPDTSVPSQPTPHDNADPTTPDPRPAEPKTVVTPDNSNPHPTPDNAGTTPPTPDSNPAPVQTSSSTTSPATSTPSMAGFTPHASDSNQRPATPAHPPATDSASTPSQSRPESTSSPTLSDTSTRPDPNRPHTNQRPDATHRPESNRSESPSRPNATADAARPTPPRPATPPADSATPSRNERPDQFADHSDAPPQDADRELVQTGGAIGPRDPSEDVEWAEAAYEHFRADDSDIADIANNLADQPRRDGGAGFTRAEIEQIKNHLMRDEHLLGLGNDGHTRERFAPSRSVAEAWIRLRSGEPLPQDIVLLEHELAESQYLRDHPGATAAEAHSRANESFNWQADVPARTGESYDTPRKDQNGTDGVLQPDSGRPERGGVPLRGDGEASGPPRDHRQADTSDTGPGQQGGRPTHGDSGPHLPPVPQGRNLADHGPDTGLENSSLDLPPHRPAADPEPADFSLDLPPIETPARTPTNPDATHDHSTPRDQGTESSPEWSLNLDPDTFPTRAPADATPPVGDARPVDTTAPFHSTPAGPGPHRADTTAPPVGPNPHPDDVHAGQERTHTPPEQPTHPDGPPRSPTDDDSPARPDEPRPSLRDMFPSNGLPADPNRLLPLLRQAIDGEYGGLRVEVENLTCIPNELNVKGKIWSLPDRFGYRRLVGEFSRDFTIDGDGRITANHDFLKVEEDVQGQGFATEFNRAMFDWYRESGVHKVTLLANIDVGSYAWARHGFTFADEHIAIDQIRPRLENEIDRATQRAEALRQQLNSLPPGQERSPLERQLNDLDSIISQGQAILDRFEVGSPNFPTPKEISQLGRPADLSPEQARDQTWPGKTIFMEPGESILWNGELLLDTDTGHPLSPDNPTAGQTAHHPTRDPGGHETDSLRNSNPEVAPDTHSTPIPSNATPAVGDAAPVNTPTPGSTPFQPTPVGPDLRRPETSPPPVGPDPHPDDVRPESGPTNAPPGQPTRSDIPPRSPASTPPPAQPTGPYPGQGQTPEPPRWAHQNPNHHADATRLPDWWPQPTSGPAATHDNGPTTRHPAPGTGNPGRATPAPGRPYPQPHPGPGENLTRAPESNPPARPVPPPHTPRPTTGPPSTPPPNTPPNGPSTQPRAGLPPHPTPPGIPLYGEPNAHTTPPNDPGTPPRAGLPPHPTPPRIPLHGEPNAHTTPPNDPGTPPRAGLPPHPTPPRIPLHGEPNAHTTPPNDPGTPPRAGLPPHPARPDATGMPHAHTPSPDSAPTTPIPHARPNIPGATPPHAGMPSHPGQPNATGTPPAHTRPPNDGSRPPYPVQPHNSSPRQPTPPHSTRSHDPATRPPHPGNHTPYNDHSTPPPRPAPPSHPARPIDPRTQSPATRNQPIPPRSPSEGRGRPEYRGVPDHPRGQRPEDRRPVDHPGTPPHETTGRPQHPHPVGDRAPASNRAPDWDGRRPDLPPDHPARQPGAEHWRPEPGTAPRRGPENVLPPERRSTTPADSHAPRHTPDERSPERPHEEPRPNRTEPPPPTDTHNDSRTPPDEPRPRLRDLFPSDGRPADPNRLLPLLRQVIDGEYSGLRVRVEHVIGGLSPFHAVPTYDVKMMAEIYDAEGKWVGSLTRIFTLESNGRISVIHQDLELIRSVQGQGFATELNRAMFDWYRESGVHKVVLLANIDVGSYAWARQGFTFADHHQAIDQIRPRLAREVDRAIQRADALRQQLNSLPPGPERSRLESQFTDLVSTIGQGQEILDRFQVGSPNFPTPLEISQLGRPADAVPGQSRQQTWPGKSVFMEPGEHISWDAEMILEQEQR
ncbi:hypothetical protein [Nocardia sp. N2S4-5]|uniref:WXG100-like domain-containing protein n=1 Tax=Nocardia sp. N2S4-5 TaxID=3351565 RepID=UPI0037D56A0D